MRPSRTVVVLLLIVPGSLLAHDLFLKLPDFFVAPETVVKATVLNGTLRPGRVNPSARPEARRQGVQRVSQGRRLGPHAGTSRMCALAPMASHASS